jgi:quaternary ammonium compound-resistance protein SugE
MTPWLYLIFAGLFEVAFTSCLVKLKLASGAASYLWFAGFALACALSMLLLSKATAQIPMGTAYAVWTGIGAAGTALMGFLVFKDPVSFWKVFFLVTLIVSVAGLKFVAE